jgi:hypothetical protein
MYIITHNTSKSTLYFVGALRKQGEYFVKCLIFKDNQKEEKLLKLHNYDNDLFLIEDSIITMLVFKSEIFKLRLIKNYGKAK